MTTSHDAPGGAHAPLPKLDFSTFVLSVVGSAYVHLGDAPGPDGKPDLDLDLARQDIALLGLLEEKTKGNLTGEEERLVQQALYDLRLRWLEVAKAAGRSDAGV